MGALTPFGLQVQPIRLRVDFGASGSCLKRNLVTMAARGGESLDHDGVYFVEKGVGAEILRVAMVDFVSFFCTSSFHLSDGRVYLLRRPVHNAFL